MNIEDLALLVLGQRGNMCVRAAASEIGISPTFKKKKKKGHVPDVGTLERVCAWLGEEPSTFNGIGNLQIAFKNRKAVPPATAKALAALIERAAKQFADQIEARGHH